jgi:hypothetical protein
MSPLAPVHRTVLALFLLLLAGPRAHALSVLTTGKHAVFRSRTGLVRFGQDRALAPLVDPTCAGGAAASIQVAAFPQATWRVVGPPAAALPCERWRRAAGGAVVYEDDGTVAGVRRIFYSSGRLVIRLGGPGYQPVAGPVGYVELWLTLGERGLLGRFHSFVRNEPTLLVTRRPSRLAADGEAAFWDVLFGDDRSEARQQQAITLLEKASRRSRRDGRARFLLAMMRLYRFGLRLTDFAHPSAEAVAEIGAAHDAFQQALPVLWDGARGDSRVPGFAAAAKFAKGFVEGDAALTAAGLADLDAAIAANPFFNVFDLIPVIQAVPRSDPRFASAFARMDAYLTDPETLACVGTQPEICNNAGLAPHNLSGSLLLFGDVYAKAGDLAQASTWYTLARALTPASPPYRFQALVDGRVADAAGRVARYLDADPGNDDPIVGMGEESCTVCHTR